MEPHNVGVDDHDPDASHTEAVHLVADDARTQLRASGFTETSSATGPTHTSTVSTPATPPTSSPGSTSRTHCAGCRDTSADSQRRSATTRRPGEPPATDPTTVSRGHDITERTGTSTPALVLDMPVDAEEAERIGRLDGIVYDPTNGCISYLIVVPEAMARGEWLIHSDLIEFVGTRLRLNIARSTLAWEPKSEADDRSETADIDRGRASYSPAGTISQLRSRAAVHEQLAHSDVTVRRTVAVVDAKGVTIGHVRGVMIAAPAQHVTAVIVAPETDPTGTVVVPMSKVEAVADDRVTVTTNADPSLTVR